MIFVKIFKKCLHYVGFGATLYCERAMSASVTADSSRNYERRISSESKIICEADLRKMQDHQKKRIYQSNL